MRNGGNDALPLPAPLDECDNRHKIVHEIDRVNVIDIDSALICPVLTLHSTCKHTTQLPCNRN